MPCPKFLILSPMQWNVLISDHLVQTLDKRYSSLLMIFRQFRGSAISIQQFKLRPNILMLLREFAMLRALLCTGALRAASAARVPEVLQAALGGGLGVGWLLVTRVCHGEAAGQVGHVCQSSQPRTPHCTLAHTLGRGHYTDQSNSPCVSPC